MGFRTHPDYPRARGNPDNNWDFVHGRDVICLKGDFDSEEFRGHYRELCRIFYGDHGVVDHGIVYFISWTRGPIKIGVARNVNQRLASLQISSPHKLGVLASTTGGYARERAYHRQFVSHRLRGEWFVRCPAILEEIDRLNGASP